MAWSTITFYFMFFNVFILCIALWEISLLLCVRLGLILVFSLAHITSAHAFRIPKVSLGEITAHFSPPSLSDLEFHSFSEHDHYIFIVYKYCVHCVCPDLLVSNISGVSASVSLRFGV